MVKELIGAGLANGDNWNAMLNMLVRLDYCLGVGNTEAAKRELEAALYYTRIQIDSTERYLRMLNNHVGDKKDQSKQDDVSYLIRAIAEELSQITHLPKDMIMPELKEEPK